jgi:hypothetical protein
MMKRLYLAAAVAGLWPVAELRAQEGLAPTAPVVPAPILQNGNVLTPAGNGWGTGGSRLFTTPRWSPFRNPAVASTIEPTALAPATAQPLPPLPSGVSSPAADCGPNGCGRPARNRSCWERIRALLCYHDSPTGLPKCRPTPFVAPIQGSFPCSSGPSCAFGSPLNNAGAPAFGSPVGQPSGQPLPYPQPYVLPPTQPMPLPVPPGKTAGPVMMPPRGTQGSPVQPTWQGRVVPESAVSTKPAPGPIVPTGYLKPAPK